MLLFNEAISAAIWAHMNEIERIERRISLHDLRVLMLVVQAGSMGKAAKRLATSQPAVSRSIADLESALGVRLLDRSPQGIEPTPYGRALLKRGISVFDELTEGVKDIRFLADPTAGELRIGASIAIAAGFVSSVINRLCQRYPRLAFQVIATDTATAYRALLDRQVDLAVVHIIEPIAEEYFNAEPLFQDPHVVVAGVQNPLIRRRRLALADDERALDAAATRCAIRRRGLRGFSCEQASNAPNGCRVYTAGSRRPPRNWALFVNGPPRRFAVPHQKSDAPGPADRSADHIQTPCTRYVEESDS
jgi:DNA-binding transcriptional LysR family regulator